MGGFFGAVSDRDVALDVFFGTDYHSHLGTRRGGMVLFDKKEGFQRQIHNIENTPFRTKFERDLADFRGHAGLGCISDSDPQPLLVRSHLGLYAIVTVGIINNTDELVKTYLSDKGQQFLTLSSGRVNVTELTAALINQENDLVSGILHAQEVIDGSMTILILTEEGELIAARDSMGRLPVLIGQREDGYCVSFESFAYHKLDYQDAYELGPREIVRLNAKGFQTLSPAGKQMKICAFLWTYYGYPNSNYEGVNVELMRYRNGAIMARDEAERGGVPEVDFVAGVPDSGVPHAMGYANQSGKPLARPFVKYTPTWPRSFMPEDQQVRSRVARMKQIPVPELIEGKKLLFVDDSIVRGTQLRETVDFLYSTGAAEVHMRSACPPIMYPCRYLNFSRGNSAMDLLARRMVQELEGNEGQKHLEEYADSRDARCLATRDIRLARRLVRDCLFRGHGAAFTLGLWGHVCAGEDRYIKPYKPRANLLLDTTHTYEVCLWRTVLDTMPADPALTATQARQLAALREKFAAFPALGTELVPQNSMLREFIGK